MATSMGPAAAAREAREPRVTRALELAAVMDRAAGPRLLAAERLVLSLPALCGEALDGVELFFSPTGALTAIARLASGAGVAALRQRFAFWCARAGARGLSLGDLDERQRDHLNGLLARCPRRAAMAGDAVEVDARSFFTGVGASPERSPDEGAFPWLELSLTGPTAEGLRWDPGSRRLFVPSPLWPPEGDSFSVLLCTPAHEPQLVRGRVAAVQVEARPGAPTGLALELAELGPVAAAALAEHVPQELRAVEAPRASPRYALRAPARVSPQRLAPGESSPPSLDGDGRPRFVLEDLSQGGAFIAAEERWPRGTKLHVVAALPTGDLLRADAEVVVQLPRGIGVRWLLDPLSEGELSGLVARVAARPRRALVVDDDALPRNMVSDALRARGFEVLVAEDGAQAFEILSEELLSLDLLVADIHMPRMDGEALLRTVRQAGGESELTIVMISGKVEAGLEAKLRSEGADAVLPKSLGPKVVAQAAVAVLERKAAGRTG